MYDGELAMSFRSVPDSFWRERIVLAERLLRILRNALDLFGEDIQPDGKATITRLEGLVPP
jgi:hypothetical protein